MGYCKPLTTSVATSAGLTAAIGGTANGGTIKLATDVELTEAIAMSDLTLDGNGETIDASGAIGAGNSNSNCVVTATSGTIQNVTIVGARRAVGTGSTGTYAMDGDVVIDNSYIEGVVYAINIGNGGGKNLVVTDSTLYGWSSYADLNKATFENCVFGKGNSNYNYLRPQNDSVFIGCEFETGFMIGAVGGNFDITLTNCTVNGVAVTAANFVELLTGLYQNTWDDTAVLKTCTITVNGTIVVWPSVTP